MTKKITYMITKNLKGFQMGNELHNINWPWLTDPAIDFLEIYLKPDMRILEFGCGGSTIWFKEKCKSVISIEHDWRYYKETKARLKDHSGLRILQLPYYGVMNTFIDNYFDAIIVDGRNRKRCIYHSIPKVKPGGIIMLDNSERPYYHSVYEHLKDWEKFDCKQIEPNRIGFNYGKYTTTYWIKPNEQIRN